MKAEHAREGHFDKIKKANLAAYCEEIVKAREIVKENRKTVAELEEEYRQMRRRHAEERAGLQEHNDKTALAMVICILALLLGVGIWAAMNQ